MQYTVTFENLNILLNLKLFHAWKRRIYLYLHSLKGLVA